MHLKRTPMDRPEGVKFVWTGNGFGNALILAHLTRICADNGIPAVFRQHKTTAGLVDVPLSGPEHEGYYKHTWKGVRNTYLRKNCDEPVIVQYIKDVERLFGVDIGIMSHHDHVPVVYQEMPEIRGVDVAMWTQTGPWAPVRMWPHFPRLKEMFDAEGITYVDMTEIGAMGFACLNWVKKSKLYLGLETGTSHYVSQFANHKALILQSGFCPFVFWTYLYYYDCVRASVECRYRPCFLTRDESATGIECPHGHACMEQLAPETVLAEVKRRLQ